MTQAFAQIAARSNDRLDQTRERMKARFKAIGNDGRNALTSILMTRIQTATTETELDILELAALGADVVLASLATEEIEHADH